MGELSLSDIDEINLKDIRSRDPLNKMKIKEIFNHDFAKNPLTKQYDAVYMMDVFEHIEKTDSHNFLVNLNNSLIDHGVAIIGIPSIESQKYASKYSRAGHVNCLSKNEFKLFLENY